MINLEIWERDNPLTGLIMMCSGRKRPLERQPLCSGGDPSEARSCHRRGHVRKLWYYPLLLTVRLGKILGKWQHIYLREGRRTFYTRLPENMLVHLIIGGYTLINYLILLWIVWTILHPFRNCESSCD